MNLEKSIDVIIKQEQKEIRTYNIFAFFAITAFFILLCFNLINGYIKDLAAAGTNFLSLAVGYIPFQQISKRKKRIYYFDKIIRLGISENGPDKEKFDGIVIEAIKEVCKN
jgi:hypothetical protein